MIEKMKFLNITGPKADIDRVVETYLSKYEIHLENALSELTDVAALTPFSEANPYKEALTAVNGFYAELENPEKLTPRPIPVKEALALVTKFQKESQALTDERKQLEEKHAALIEPLKIIRHFRNIEFDVSSILNFKFIHYRFGRIDKQYFQKFSKYIYDNIDTLFIKCEEDEQYYYGIYFVPKHKANQIHAIYSSMHFEQIYISDSYDGTAREACERLEAVHKKIHTDMEGNSQAWKKFLFDNAQDMVSAKAAIAQASDNFDIRKMAACTTGDNNIFYILCGWMTETDAEDFQKDIKNDSNVFCLVGEDQASTAKQPPTKLKNIKLLKPFEMYIKMYGLPAYGEMDPTWFLALTYSFIFGAMFGDVGQGLLLFIGGALLYKFKKMDLAGIISCAGIFSTIFGFLYGSFFGFEDVIPALWLKPMSAMTTVPFVGKLNTVFVVAVGFGMFLILICMIFNIINSFRNGDVEKTWFDANAVAGLVFYGSIIAVIGLMMAGKALPGGIVLGAMFGVPLILMFMKEPLTNLVKKKAEIMPAQKGVFFVQSFFEMFEVLLSYLSNTISFLRIGAFAVSHAAMMEVVLMLAGAENGASPNWIVIVLGNLFVCAMEGLIVGIQVLRLEYYEIFSRFYKGSGREFRPFSQKNTGA